MTAIQIRKEPRHLTGGDVEQLKLLALKLAETRYPHEVRPMVEAVAGLLEELNGYSTLALAGGGLDG